MFKHILIYGMAILVIAGVFLSLIGRHQQGVLVTVITVILWCQIQIIEKAIKYLFKNNE